MVGLALDGFDAFGVGDTEIRGGGVEQGARVLGERRHFGDPGFVRERLEPDDLDPDAIADQSVLAELLGESRHLVAVAAVQRA